MKTIYTKDEAKKKIAVERFFSAPLEAVWRAWTEKDLLEQWWAPKPWKAETKTMNFTEGGCWHYAMVGPDGTRMYARVDFKVISVHDYFTAKDSFCDEEGKVNTEFPSYDWKNNFFKADQGTKVIVELTFASEADMLKIVEMGFEQGFAMAHDNLDELLKTVYHE